MRSGSGTAIGLSRTALTTEKIAVLAPMPSVSAATAANVKAGALVRVRIVNRRSVSSSSMTPLGHGIVAQRRLRRQMAGMGGIRTWH